MTFILVEAHARRNREDETAYVRAGQLLEDLIDRELDNLLARIKLAELHSTREPFDRLESEHLEVHRDAQRQETAAASRRARDGEWRVWSQGNREPRGTPARRPSAADVAMLP